MEQNEWTVRTFPASRLLPNEKLSVQWLVQIAHKVLIMDIHFPEVILWSTDRGCLTKTLDWWMTGFGRMATTVLRDKGIHQMLSSSQDPLILVLASAIPPPSSASLLLSRSRPAVWPKSPHMTGSLTQSSQPPSPPVFYGLLTLLNCFSDYHISGLTYMLVLSANST